MVTGESFAFETSPDALEVVPSADLEGRARVHVKPVPVSRSTDVSQCAS